MILRGTTRLHNDPTAELRELEAVCDNFDQGRTILHDQVPDGWDLLHIIVDH